MKSKTDQITIDIDTKRKRRKNAPRTAFKPGNKYRFVPGVSGNPAGRGKPDEHKLVTKSLRAHLANRAPRSVTSALNLPCSASWSQCIALVLCRRAVSGDMQAASMIMLHTEGLPKAHLTLADENGVRPEDTIHIVFEASDGDGRLKRLPTTIDGNALAPEALMLPD